MTRPKLARLTPTSATMERRSLEYRLHNAEVALRFAKALAKRATERVGAAQKRVDVLAAELEITP